MVMIFIAMGSNPYKNRLKQKKSKFWSPIESWGHFFFFWGGDAISKFSRTSIFRDFVGLFTTLFWRGFLSVDVPINCV